MRNPSHKAVLPPIKFELTDLPEVIEPETDSEIAELWEDWDRAVAQADAKSQDGRARRLWCTRPIKYRLRLTTTD